MMELRKQGLGKVKRFYLKTFKEGVYSIATSSPDALPHAPLDLDSATIALIKTAGFRVPNGL